MPDGNPRCIAYHLLEIEGVSFDLVEVDTSDNTNRLSTLILKRQESSRTIERERLLLELEIRLIKKSLAWPTSYLKKNYGTGFRRVLHPQSSSTNKALLDPDSIDRWAERVFSTIQKI